MFRKLINTSGRKFTVKYYEHYRIVKKRLPYTEPLKEHFITHNLDLLIHNNNFHLYHTDMMISYPDLPFMASLNKIRQKFGNPGQFAIYQLNEHTLSLAAFKSLVLSDENKIVLYFFDEELMEYEYILFHLKENEYKDVLQRIVIDKYLPARELNKDDGFYIEDTDKNQIFVYWNGFDLSIKFLSCFSNVYREAFIDYYNNTWKQKKKEAEKDDENNP